MTNINTRPAELLMFIRQPFVLIGPPGGGKTEWVNAVARAMSLPCYPVVASDPVDVQGIPGIVNGRVIRSYPPFARKILESPGALGVAFLDEINTHGESVLEAYLQFVQQGLVGDEYHKNNFIIVAAMNPASQTASGLRLPPALANRLVHLPWQVNFADWREGLMNDWADDAVAPFPGNWRDFIPRWKNLVAAFLTANQSKFSPGKPDDEDKAAGPWPSPRTWHILTNCLAVAEADSLRMMADTALRLLSGTVGDEAATEFAAYLRNLDLPDPETLLKAGTKAKLPDRPDAVFACLNSVAQAVAENATKDRFTAAWEVVCVAADKNMIDSAAPAIKRLTEIRNANPSVGSVPKTALAKLAKVGKLVAMAGE